MFVQSKWPVHHGRTGLQLPVYNGRPGLHNPRPLQRSEHSQTQPLLAAVHWLCQCSAQLLHGEDVHAHEAAVSSQFTSSDGTLCFDADF